MAAFFTMTRRKNGRIRKPALLIQEDSYRDFVAAGNFSWDRIADLAHHSNVPEYIVVGRLPHDGHLPWQHEYSRRIPIYTWE